MSGTIASRNQARFTYGPALRIGAQPVFGAAPAEQPAAPPPQQAAPTPAPAAPAQQQTPVAAGTDAMPGNEGARGGDIGSTPDGGLFGLGPNPGSLSGLGISGLGGFSWGSTLGGLAGGLIAGPIGSAIGYGLGSAFNQSALEGRIGEVFSPSQDLTVGGLSNAPAGTGATVSDPYGGIEAGSGYGKDGAGVGGDKSNPSSGADFGKDSPGTAPDGGAKGSDGGTSAGDAGGGGYGGADASDSPGGDGDGWMKGGYTGHGGDGMVDPAQPAGTVHEGEIVIPAHQVARYGLPALMALVHGDVAPSKLAALARG